MNALSLGIEEAMRPITGSRGATLSEVAPLSQITFSDVSRSWESRVALTSESGYFKSLIERLRMPHDTANAAPITSSNVAGSGTPAACGPPPPPDAPKFARQYK